MRQMSAFKSYCWLSVELQLKTSFLIPLFFPKLVANLNWWFSIYSAFLGSNVIPRPQHLGRDTGNEGLQQWHSLWAGSGWPARSPPPHPRLCWVFYRWPAAWSYGAAGPTAEQLRTEPGRPWGERLLSLLLLPHRSWWTCTKEDRQLLSWCMPSISPVLPLFKYSSSVSPIRSNTCWCKNSPFQCGLQYLWMWEHWAEAMYLVGRS